MHAYTAPRPGRQQQCGQSLISMMVGLVISLITIAAMMTLYKTMVEVSSNASRSALRDGQVSAALLSAQMDLQSAGFGVPAADSLNSKLYVREAGKELVWRYKAELTASGYVCSGLRLVDGEGLYRFTPKVCSDAEAATWNGNEQRLLAGSAAFFTPAQRDGSAFESGEEEVGAMTLAPGYVFSLKGQRQCLPYMQQDFSATPTAAVGQQLALERSDGSSHLFMACLPNLAVTS